MQFKCRPHFIGDWQPQCRDLKTEVAQLRIKTASDQAYSYQSGDTQLLAIALERAVAMPTCAAGQKRPLLIV